MDSPRATAPLLHRFLGIGLVLLSAAAGALKLAGTVPMLPPDEATAMLAPAFAAIAAALIVMAWMVFKPAVPGRRPGQSVDAYWTDPDVLPKVMRVWFLAEGAGVLSLVGYFVTGAAIVAVAAALAMVSFWMCGPSRFAQP
jgi:hypothetical protein